VVETAKTTAAQERFDKILEQEKKEAREAKLREIMRQQKAEMKNTLGGGSD